LSTSLPLPVRGFDLALRSSLMIVDVDGMMTIGEFSERCDLSAKILRA
jgi:hypothetical protein